MGSMPLGDHDVPLRVPIAALPRAWLRLLLHRGLPLPIVMRWETFCQYLDLHRHRPRTNRMIQCLKSLMPSAGDDELQSALLRNQTLRRIGGHTFAPVFGRTRSWLTHALRPVGLETLDELSRQDKGVIVLGSHIGFISWVGPALINLGYPLYLMQRPHVSPRKRLMIQLSNWTDRMLPWPESEEARRLHLKRLHDMLRENAWMQHLADAPDPISGVEGQLFDHRVRCIRAPWALARLSGAAAVPVLILADDDLRPQLLVGPAIHVASEGPAASAINAAFHTYLKFLEEALAGRRWNMSLSQWAGMAQGEHGSRP